MNLIVAMDCNNGIGKNGDLLFHIPEDMERFKNLTKNSNVIMGRKTLESLPEGKPLKGRGNIVFTRNVNHEGHGYKVVNNINDLKNIYNNNSFYNVIGGSEIYKELADYCKMAFVTVVYDDFNADTFFPNIFDSDNWEIKAESDYKTTNIDGKECKYKFLTLMNKTVKAL